MYKMIDENNQIYTLYSYSQESEYEKMIVDHQTVIFGEEGIYFNIKKLIGTPKKGATKPDGYYLDLTFHTEPKLYLVEIELHQHDVYAHIGEQLLRFGIASQMDKYKIKQLLLEEIQKDEKRQEKLNDYFMRSPYNNMNELLDKVVFDNAPAAIIIIDQATEELNHVMKQLTMNVDIIEVQTYVCGSKKIHRFTPFKEEVLLDIATMDDADELDTIVVPAREEGFREEFLSNERWFAIRISSMMLDKIKYIAVYQVAPVSAITYVAEIDFIEKYKDTNKYIVFFKTNTLHKISKIPLGLKKGLAPQAPRYTSYHTLMAAKSLDDIWG